MSQANFSFSDSAVLSRLSRDVHILASDSFAGRKSGTEAEKKASLYIISCFREAGLTTAGTGDSSYLQPFPVASYTTPRDSNTLSIEGYQETILFRRDFCPAAYSANGLVNTKRYIMIDLDPARVPVKKMPRDTSASLSDTIRKAFQQGHSCVILYNEGLLAPVERRLLYARGKVKPGDGPVISVSPGIAAFLQKHPGANISASVNVLRSVSTCHNIIGSISNGAPYTVVVGAHYDHVGISGKGKVFNGADDNASGTAMMMELARYLKQSGDKTSNYLFVAFSAEEDGLYGSDYFAEHPTVGLQTINFMVNLDMVGRLGCEGKQVTIFGTGTSPYWRTLYKETPHPAFRICRMHGVNAFTDHVGFYQHGIPVISLTTGFHYEYHTTRDDAETLNYPGMADLTSYLEGLIHGSLKEGKVGFQKVAQWYDLSANFKIILRGIDHMMAVGMEE